MSSLWTKTAELPAFPALRGDLRTDVLVIGGGMAGLLCAWQLHRAGIGCVLVEAARICSGTTGGTTAKITSQHGLIYAGLLRTLGRERTQLYLQAQERAIDAYRQLSQEIDCDFAEQHSAVYTLHDRRKIDAELEALHQLGFPATEDAAPPLPFPVAGAVRFPRQGQFHPLRFAAGIAKDLRIFEHTPVRQLAPGRAVTPGGCIRAEKIILATHFPMPRWQGAYFLKQYQHRSYVLALRGTPPMEGMYVDADTKGLSFRHHGELLLLGGGSHRTGRHGGGWRELERFAAQHYPGAEVVHRWAAQDCMTLDQLPYVGPCSRRSREWLVATGFCKWGMTSAMVAAELLTAMVQGQNHPLAEVLNPARSMLHPQLFLNAAEAAVSLLTPTAPRCPHMGCALKYNRAERSWDCPCHGSRFEEDGTLIDNPARGNKRL